MRYFIILIAGLLFIGDDARRSLPVVGTSTADAARSAANNTASLCPEPTTSPGAAAVATLNLEIRFGDSAELERAYRFLWTNWQARRPAQVNATFYGIDAGAICTVNVRRNDSGRWQIDEYRRGYHVPEERAEPLQWVQTAYRVRPVRSRRSGFSIELVSSSGRRSKLFNFENGP